LKDDTADIEHVNQDADSKMPQDAACNEDEDDYEPIVQQDNEMRHPQYFYGFWGQCINDYRKVAPHEGYGIIARWGRDKNESASESEPSDVAQRIRAITQKLEGTNLKSASNSQEPYYVSPTERAGAFFFFTSNVDAHSYDVFQSHEIRECHGNTEVWQCRNFHCGTNETDILGRDDDSSLEELACSAGTKNWERRLWRLPLDHVFEIDATTMSAPPTKMNELPIQDTQQNKQENMSRKRKSESDICNLDGDTEEALDYLQNQFDAADNPAAPAHIGDVHGKKRVTHLKSMMHPTPSEEPDHYLPIYSSDNWPRCPRCHELGRPAVLMFDDLDWVYNSQQEKRWQRWYRAVLKLCKSRASGDHSEDDSHDSDFTSVNDSDVSNEGWENVSDDETSDCKPSASELNPSEPMKPDLSPTTTNIPVSQLNGPPLKVLILEIGCGYNVPTCRMISETLVKHLTERGGDPNLVRINPTHPEADNDEIEDRFIGIGEKGLRVLKEIDAVYQQLLLGEGKRTI
jgi:NAD-dependent SIR2 family protein deacetylase